MISPAFIDDLIAILKTHRRNTGFSFYIPNNETFVDLFTITFFASLKKEEGESIKFKLVIVDKQHLDDFVAINKVYPLDTDIQFQIESIIKIAPAHNAQETALVIVVDESTRGLKIYGFFQVKKLYKKTLYKAISDSCLEETFPDNILISTTDVGNVKIYVSGTAIGSMIDGKFVNASRSSFTDKSLGYHLDKHCRSHELYSRFGKNYLHIYKEIIKKLLAEAARRGHGSTIVLIAPSDIEGASIYYKPRYILKETINLTWPIWKSLQVGNESDDCEKNALDIINNIVMLAQLATVDGALIMTHDLELLSFGATLKAGQWDGSVLTGPDGSGNGAGKDYQFSRLGTRHNSAIAFASQCKSSYVFVISHDGPIRAFLSYSDEFVTCWPDCTL